MDKRTQAVIQLPPGTIDISQHQRRCTICSHPEREAIEEAFLQWRSSRTISIEFRLLSRTTIFRHAHALGLFEKRRRNLRFALEHIIEDAERVKPTPHGVIRAIRAYTQINDSGEWSESPAQVVISNRYNTGNRKRRK